MLGKTKKYIFNKFKNNNLKLNKMKKLVNKVKKQDKTTKIGLSIVLTIILPLVTVLINEIIIKGSVLHY